MNGTGNMEDISAETVPQLIRFLERDRVSWKRLAELQLARADALSRRIEEMRAALVQFVAACDTAPPTSLMMEIGMACDAARAALDWQKDAAKQ